MTNNKSTLPELLAPAGSPEALSAAIDAGADAVYFGAGSFNARINAKNFDSGELRAAIELCHSYGVKSYVTMNTLVYDLELPEYLRCAEELYKMGVDALIVADIGGATTLKKYIPDITLHASTQASGHCVEAAKTLSELGFSRMVLARETSLQNIRTFTENSPIEAEVFVHGALCVSHSGQCLFSSIVGGRSGNRGECAQPCRLPFGNKYPLSLKDLCLAPHIPSLISAGVASLKIEGRMKSPEYVREVTAIYRTLLDENRGATADEIKYLSSIFSRGGFTDGYFTENIGSRMLGIRSESDKESSRETERFSGLTRRLGITLVAEVLRGEPIRLTIMGERGEVTVTGDAPLDAINAPMTEADIKKQLSRLGNTPLRADAIDISLDEGLIVPISSLNALRRNAVAKYLGSPSRNFDFVEYTPPTRSVDRKDIKTASFYDLSQITEVAKDYFDIRFLPLSKFDKSAAKRANGVILPPVIFDSDRAEISALARSAKENGAVYALCGNLGHIEIAKEAGLLLFGDIRLNIANRETASLYSDMGFYGLVLSPELTLPQIRDIGGSAVVYGRIPLMLLEKCVGLEIGGCDRCNAGELSLRDRRGVSFPVLRELDHRSVIYNSLPTYMGDKKDKLTKYRINSRHFIFSTEKGHEVDSLIASFEAGRPLSYPVRRIQG